MAAASAGGPTDEQEWAEYARTGPGTLAGRYLRTFWHAVYRSQDLQPGWAVPIKILSEELTLYRGETGIAHLVQFRCPHRGTQLSTGWVEDDCIRCRYHGWMFDGGGQCVQQPMEDADFATRVKIRSYPIEENMGAIFVYVGEGDAPPLPRYPTLESAEIIEVERLTRACNYVNVLENDPGHGSFVHRDPKLPRGVFYWPNVIVHENEYGIERISVYPKGEVRVSHRGMPGTMLTKSPPRDEKSGWRDTLHWWTPIDDENTLQISIDVLHLAGQAARRYKEARDAWYATGGKVSDPELSERILAGDERLQDHDQRADVNMIRVQDDVTQVGQGRIRDRADERLGRSDAYVVLLRQLWVRELRALAEGRSLKQWRLPEDFVLTEGYQDAREGPRRYG